jgi:hypothetical protein
VQLHGELGARLDEVLLVGREVLELGEVGARAKPLPRARQHHAADRVIGIRGAQGIEQRLCQRGIQRVALLRTIQGEDAHGATVLDQQENRV